MRIAFLDKAAHPYLGEALTAAGHTVDDLTDRDRPAVLTALPAYDGLMIRSRLNIDRELLDAAGERLKFVARWGWGPTTLTWPTPKNAAYGCSTARRGASTPWPSTASG